MSAFWSGHAGAAGGCCCSSGVRFGVGMLVPVQVAAASCCALAALAAGAAPGCRCRVPLQAAAAGCCFRVLLLAVRVLCALWSWRAGAAGGLLLPGVGLLLLLCQAFVDGMGPVVPCMLRTCISSLRVLLAPLVWMPLACLLPLLLLGCC